MKDKINSGIALCKEIQFSIKSDLLILYRFDNTLMRYKWGSALLSRNLDLNFFKNMKNTYIPASNNNLIFQIDFLAKDIIELPREQKLNGLYEKETIGKFPSEYMLFAIPLIDSNGLQGLVLFGKKEKFDPSGFKDILNQHYHSWSIKLFSINKTIKTNIVNHKNQHEKYDSKIEKSSVFYIDISILLPDCTKSEEIILQEFFKLLYAIIKESIHGSSSILIHGNTKTVMIYNHLPQKELQKILKQIHVISSLLNESLQAYNKIKIRYGFSLSAFYVLKHKHNTMLSGPNLSRLERITRLSVPGHVQVCAQTAKNIQHLQPLKFRGKALIEKNAKPTKLYLFDGSVCL